MSAVIRPACLQLNCGGKVFISGYPYRIYEPTDPTEPTGKMNTTRKPKQTEMEKFAKFSLPPPLFFCAFDIPFHSSIRRLHK